MGRSIEHLRVPDEYDLEIDRRWYELQRAERHYRVNRSAYAKKRLDDAKFAFEIERERMMTRVFTDDESERVLKRQACAIAS
jgi:hypothetical protein